jgi:dihydrofolate reductase
MARYWPTERAQADDPAIVHLMNSTSKIVFSRESIRADWSNTRLITEHAIDELAKMKIQPGGNMCVLGSSNLCVSLMQANLIDEWRVMINPVLLGRGNTVYDGITDRLRLKHTGTKIFKSGNVLLYYCQT